MAMLKSATMLIMFFFSMIILAGNAPVQAANYEFSHDRTGYHCGVVTSNVTGGSQARWSCASIVEMVDKDSGTLYQCNAGFVVVMINDKYYSEPTPPSGECIEILTNQLPSTSSWQFLPAADIAPIDPAASVTSKPLYFWEAAGTQITACLQVPFTPGVFPSKPIMFETACISITAK
jgi:hypothetical protein